jgi:hypothetical protein
MTVKELIAALEALNVPNHIVITDLHSEWAGIDTPDLVVGYDNGGYVAEARTPEQRARAHGFVHIGPKYGSV